MHRCAVLATSLVVSHAAVWMPAIFSDGLVLQQQSTYDQRPFFYGYADPGEIVVLNRTASTGGDFQSYSATADTTGFWISQWNCDNSASDFTVTIAGSSDNYAQIKTIYNVTYGDVYVCSGQSNMVFSVKSDFIGPEIASKPYPNIRLFAIAQSASETPQRDVPSFNGSLTPCWWPQNPRPQNSTQQCNTWQVAMPGITDEFSATCFFTVLQLSQQFPGRQFGLVYGAVDGTPMQAWSPPEALAKCNSTNAGAAAAETADANAAASSIVRSSTGNVASGVRLLNGVNPNDPMVLWNAMINPISRFAIRGVIWYQGESDSGETRSTFDCKFQALIESWRRRWRIGDFAWLFVQLAPQDSVKWPNTWIFNARLAQADALPSPGNTSTDTTGMAVAYDLGDMGSPFPPDHVHPRRKYEVGRRLAAALLHTQYAYQWPAGGFNLTGVVNWRGPVLSGVSAAPASNLRASAHGHKRSGVVRKGAAAGTSFVVTFNTLDGMGIYLNNTADCWECCANGRDTVQVSDAAGLTWLNTTIAVSSSDNSSLIATVVGTVPTNMVLTQVRYAAGLWPQCAVYAAGNSIPAYPAIVNITTAVASSNALPREVVARTAATPVRSSVPIAQRGPNTWTEWKGVRIPAAPVESKGVALTPPMGFNSWNAYHCNVDENLIRLVADAFVSSGLAAVGYEYVNIDDCWQVDRNVNGTIIPDPGRFPSGLGAVADYVHAQGLKFGVYTAAHSLTCQQRPGSYQHELNDAATYCANHIDYLKIDGCGGQQWPNLNTSWIYFRQGINSCVANGGRDIVMSVESCGPNNAEDCQAWLPSLANLWRTTGDIQATWGSVLSNLDENNVLAPIAGPGHWNDPDMLQVGNAGLSFDEQKSHFGAWAIVAAPLLIGTDLVSGVDNATMSILAAPEIIAVDQDPLGVQGIRVSPPNLNGPECWAKPLADGSVAALLLNRGSTTATVTCTFAEVGLKNPNGAAQVRDLWARAELGSFTASFSSSLATHASMVVKITQ